MKNGIVNKLKSLLSISGVIFLVISVLLIISFVYHIDGVFSYKTLEPTPRESIEMENGIWYKQQLPELNDPVRGITMIFGTYGRTNHGTLHIILREDGEQLYSWDVDTAYLKLNDYKTFDALSTIEVDPSKSHTLELMDEFEEGTENYISFYTTNGRNGVETSDGSYYGNEFNIQWTLVNAAQRKVLKPVYTGLFVFLLIFAAAVLDFSKIRPAGIAVTGLCLLLIPMFIDYDLFTDINTRAVYNEWNDDYEILTLEPGQHQTFEAECRFANFDSIEFFTGKITEDTHARVISSDDGSVIYDGTITHFFDDKRAGWTGAFIEPDEGFAKGAYEITITNDGDEDLYLFVTGDGDLNAITEKTTFIAGKIFITIFFLMAFSSVFIISFAVRRYPIHKLYLAMVIPLALSYMMLFAPYDHPDTVAHYQATYRFSSIILGQGEESGRAEDVDFFENVWERGFLPMPSVRRYTGVADSIGLSCRDSSEAAMPRAWKMDFYSVLSYLPAVAGITLGRLLKFNTVICIYMGRLLMLASYIAITCRAVKRTPVGKGILMTVSLMPISLMMSGMISYDPVVMMSSVGFYSSVLYLRRNPQSVVAMVEAAIWCVMLGAVKGGGYIILLPAVMLLKGSSKSDVRNRIVLFLSGALSIVLFDVIIPKGGFFQLGLPDSDKLTAFDAIKDPVKYLCMSLEAFAQDLDYLTVNSGGARPVLNEAAIPYIIVALLFVIGGVFALVENDGDGFDPGDRKPLWAIVALSLLFTPAMLLSWTPVVYRYVDGIQGRYFLPIVPALMLIATKFDLKIPASPDREQVYYEKLWSLFYILSVAAVYYLMRLNLTR